MIASQRSCPPPGGKGRVFPQRLLDLRPQTLRPPHAYIRRAVLGRISKCASRRIGLDTPIRTLVSLSKVIGKLSRSHAPLHRLSRAVIFSGKVVVFGIPFDVQVVVMHSFALVLPLLLDLALPLERFYESRSLKTVEFLALRLDGFLEIVMLGDKFFDLQAQIKQLEA